MNAIEKILSNHSEGQDVKPGDVVMVDVDARRLSGEQIDSITTAGRDLGRGLVTIGGERSYGVGGYRESPLNDLLPVDSEIVDPLRRRTVSVRRGSHLDLLRLLSAARLRPGATVRVRIVNRVGVSEVFAWTVRSDALPVRTRRCAAPPDDRRQAIEDLYWSVLTSREFLFNH